MAVSCLFDLQDGGVGLHDGHDDFVYVVLEPVVDLFLFVDRLHQLQIERPISIEIKCLKVNLHDQYEDVFLRRTSVRDTELISAARESEKEADIRFFAPWMLRLIICPFNSSFCSFKLRLSCSG